MWCGVRCGRPLCHHQLSIAEPGLLKFDMWVYTSLLVYRPFDLYLFVSRSFRRADLSHKAES